MIKTKEGQLFKTVVHEAALINLPRLVPLPDAQRVFGPSRSTIYRLAKDGKLRLVKVGKGTFVDTDSALKLFASLPCLMPKNAA